MITCQDILELQLDGVELIAGEKGLTRPVTWTYMVQTRPFEEHMNQGNFALCVADYVRFDLEEAGKAMEELYGLGISGFGISITDDKEPVPKEMIDKANELKLPLFYIRWEGASFVDIAQSVGKIILEYEMQNKRCQIHPPATGTKIPEIPGSPGEPGSHCPRSVPEDGL